MSVECVVQSSRESNSSSSTPDPKVAVTMLVVISYIGLYSLTRAISLTSRNSECRNLLKIFLLGACLGTLK